MRLSQLFARTLREAPAEAEAPSHILLLRAAFIRQLSSGIYTTLPLGVRTMRKVERIVRAEMEAAGAQEIRMPIVLPADPWKVTGRWEAYGDLLFKITDRQGRELLLGPTHEEVVAPLVASEAPSYRDLPVNLFQIEWKYRDELRPRFGLLRVREFLMKDAYSFDRDEDGMRRSYDVMLESYRRIFDRCGLRYLVVEADPGQIGGGVNHEFIAVSEVGEDRFVACANGDYLADVEAATPRAPEPADGDAPVRPLEVLDTPNTPTIESVASLLGCAPGETLKCMMYDAGGRTVAVLVPGDRDVSEPKLERLFFPTPVRRLEDDDFEARGLVKGYVGPQALPEETTILADVAVRGRRDWITGANQLDRHVRGASTPRDFRVDRYADLVEIREGDLCPNDGGTLRIGRSIVVGHIYQLGTKYSKPLKATFVDEDGTEQPFAMACYGIGISRIMAAAAEQFHDDDGLRWPRAIAPFEVVVILANRDHERAAAEAERVYRELIDRGIEAAIDDREESAGVKFKDADLIGYPVQVVVGKRGIDAGTVDVKLRATGERSRPRLADAVPAIADALNTAP
jgi:prolyl-tRNA synthetase